jgi:hypothetical protein
MSCFHQNENIEKSVFGNYFCKKCGTLIIKSEIENEQIMLLKPNKYEAPTHIDPLIHLLKLKHSSKKYVPKQISKLYHEIREDGIFLLKSLCSTYQVSDKVFFSSISYLDRIMCNVSKISKYDFELNVIACFILAGKFSELDAYPFDYKLFNSKNGEFIYNVEDIQNAEISVLKQLNYDLSDITTFEVLLGFLHCGIVFEEEVYDINELNDVYYYTLKLLAKLVVSHVFIKFDPYSIAFSIIHFARKYYNIEIGSLKYLKFLYGIHLVEYSDCFMYIKNYLKKYDKDYEFLRPKLVNKNSYEDLYSLRNSKKTIQKINININNECVNIKPILTPSARNIDIIDHNKTKITFVPKTTRNTKVLS